VVPSLQRVHGNQSVRRLGCSKPSATVVPPPFRGFEPGLWTVLLSIQSLPIAIVFRSYPATSSGSLPYRSFKSRQKYSPVRGLQGVRLDSSFSPTDRLVCLICKKQSTNRAAMNPDTLDGGQEKTQPGQSRDFRFPEQLIIQVVGLRACPLYTTSPRGPLLWEHALGASSFRGYCQCPRPSPPRSAQASGRSQNHGLSGPSVSVRRPDRTNEGTRSNQVSFGP